LQGVLGESHDAGDVHASRWTSQQVLTKEPNLDSSCRGAVHIPGEIVVDPWLYSISLAVHARENGANILNNFEVVPSQCKFEDGVWTIFSADGKKLKAKTMVNAAGLWADLIQAQGHGTFSLSRPKDVANIESMMQLIVHSLPIRSNLSPHNEPKGFLFSVPYTTN